MTSTLNSLLSLPIPEPSLEDELRRLISRHGKEAVRKAAIEQTKSKRGRKPDPDWRLLKPIMEMDATDWLAGRDPMQVRSNYKIAQAFSEGKPGHSASATHRRIMKKLKASRRFFFLATAQHEGRSGAPFAAYLRTLKALADCRVHRVWSEFLADAQEKVEQYRERHGEPADGMTFAQLEDAIRQFDNALVWDEPTWLKRSTGGIFGGLLPKPKSD